VRAAQLLGPSTGGIRRHVATLAEALSARGVDAPVLGPAGVMEGLCGLAGVVPVPEGISPAGLLAARRALRPWRPDVDLVHAHGLKAGWTAVSGRPHRPVVLSVHNVVLDDRTRPGAVLTRALERRVLRRADRVVVMSPAMADDLAGVVPPSRLRVALPASHVPRAKRSSQTVRLALDIPAEAPLVVCPARLHPQKDLPVLLRAWPLVRRHHPSAVLAVVGEGPSRGELESLVSDLGVGDSVRLRGASHHAVDEIAAADVVVITSKWEAVPLVLAEAAQLGVPVVSTPVGVAAELVSAGGGRVVPHGDPAAVAGAIDGILDDPLAARTAAAAARDWARLRFDPDRAVDDVVDVYRELVP